MHTFGLDITKSPTNRNRDTLFWGFGAIRIKKKCITETGGRKSGYEQLTSHITRQARKETSKRLKVFGLSTIEAKNHEKQKHSENFVQRRFKKVF